MNKFSLHRPISLLAMGMAIVSCSALPSRADFKTPIALQGAKIVTGAGETIEIGTILIDKGRIQAVGTKLPLPPNAMIIDAAGLIAYPGFIDASSHLGIAEIKRTESQRQQVEDENPDFSQQPAVSTRLANRRGIRPEIVAHTLYEPTPEDLTAHRLAGFTNALIVPRKGFLEGSSSFTALGNVPRRRSVISPSVGMHASFVSGEDGQYPLTLLGMFAQFRQVMLDAQRHAKLTKYYARHPNTSDRAPEDAALDALQPVLSRKLPVIFEANTEREIRRAISLTEEFNLRLIISGGKEAWKVAALLKTKHIGVIVSLKFDEEPAFGKKHQAGASAIVQPQKREYEPLELRQQRRRLWEEQVMNMILLDKAGVTFALRTQDMKKPADLFDALRKVIERGLPTEAAVAALTSMPAEILGFQRQMGTIKSGQLANITLLNAPLEDESAKVNMVFIDGKKYVPTKPSKTASADQPASDEAETPEPLNRESEATSSQENDLAEDLLALSNLPEASWEIETKEKRKPQLQTGGNVLITHATIIPVTSATLARSSLLVRDGKIAAIGSDIEAPAGFAVIDAEGRFIIPGFVDCHSHLGVDRVNESALSISAEVRIADVIRPDSVGLYRAVAGGTTTHHVMHGSSNPIGGQNVIMKTKYGASATDMLMHDAPPTIKFALGENVIQSNSPKNWGKRFPNSRMGVEGTLRLAFEAAKRYQQEWDTYAVNAQSGLDIVAPRRDLRLEALSRVLSGNLTVHTHCYRSEEVLRLIDVAETYGFRIGTLQHVLEGYRIAPEILRHGCGASTFANDWAYKIEAYQAIPHNAAFMTRAGIVSSVNSDSPNTIRFMGQEAAKSIRWGGLTEIEALSLVTINPARQLQIEDRVGSLEIGKDADIAIFNGHPLNTYSKCVMTLIDGEVYFQDDNPAVTETTHRMVATDRLDMSMPSSRHRAYAIIHATVHPISGPVIENATVVILNDVIHAVGTDVAVPPGAGIIDAKGHHVYPGLIDAASSVGLFEIGAARGTVDQREIGDYNAYLLTASAIHPHSVHLRTTRTSGITMSLVAPRGTLIAGRSSIIRMEGWTFPELAVNDEFALHMRVPSLPVQLPRDEKKKKEIQTAHDTAVKTLAEFMEKATHYAKLKQLTDQRAGVDYEFDLNLEAMAPYLNRQKPIVFNANTYKQIVDTLAFAEQHKLRCILSGAQEAWKVATYLAKNNIPVIIATPISYPSNKYEPWDSVYQCASILDKAGVSYCFGSSSASNAFDLGAAAGMAVAHGLPADRAIHGLTLGAAKILGIDNQYGSIEVGKKADLFVVNDSPLQTGSVVSHLFIDGQPIPLSSVHTDNYEKFKRRPAPKLPPSATSLRGPKPLSMN